MMISYLKHHEIDKGRWDECISRSLNRRVYAFSWYLDIVAPGWEALAEEDYTCVFPLTFGRKSGITYLFQPFFAQQLGLFSSVPFDAGTAELFTRAIPAHFRYIDIRVSPEFNVAIPDVDISQRSNHELYLEKSYEDINAAYSQNTRRNIRKSLESGVKAGVDVHPEDLVKVFRENFGEREGKLRNRDYKRMEDLMNACLDKGNGSVRAAFDRNGQISAAAFFLTDGNRIYFLFAASCQSARENGAMFQLIDQAVKKYAGKELILDFEGGDEVNMGRFYKSFGASEILYNGLLWNRLPFLVNTGFRLTRTIRNRVK